MSASVSVKALLAATLLLGAFSAAVGAVNVLGNPEENDFVQLVGQFWAGMIFFGPAILTVSGFLAQSRSVVLGTSLLAVGAVAIAVMSWWVILPPILAVVILILGLRRASQLAAGRSTTPF